MHFSLQDNLIWLVWWLFKAHVFKTRSGSCAAFLANYDASSSATVTFGNNQYDLPPWSVSILPDCKSAVFNTAKVRQDSNHLDKTFLCLYGYANVTFKTIQNLKFNCLNIFSSVERMKIWWDNFYRSELQRHSLRWRQLVLFHGFHTMKKLPLHILRIQPPWLA